MPTLPELVARCVAHPVPLVLLDTCALLDLLREVGRADANSPQPRQGIIASARALLMLAAKPEPQVHLVCHELVPGEWNDNEQTVSKGAMTPIKRADDLIKRLNGAATGLALPAYVPSHLAERDAALVIEGILELGKRLLAHSFIISLDELCVQLAGQRVLKNEAPAAKGKPEYKDCIIVEHYLALCRKLPDAITKVFVSSNISDYGIEKKYELRAPLDKEFAETKIQWAGDLKWAQGLVNGTGRQ